MINGDSIDAQEDRIEAVTEQYEKVLEWAYARNRAEPLLPDCFPDPDRDRRLAFREVYFARFDGFAAKLHAGTVATQDDVATAKEEMDQEAEAAKFFGLDRDEAAKSGDALPALEDQPIQSPAGVLTEYGATRIPAARANLTKARAMLCYATEDSFEILRRQIEGGISPKAADMWDAQLSLWVQESVVDALARVNDGAASAIREQGRSPWVGLMPIKELISIRTGYTYLTEATEPRAPADQSGDGAALPPESVEEVFTHTVSNDLYEAVQFTLKMVVDAREIPTIVEQICKGRFHTLLRMAYEDVSSARPDLYQMTDRIYGSDPTVQLVMDFETVFFGELYRPLMPDTIREALGLPAGEE